MIGTSRRVAARVFAGLFVVLGAVPVQAQFGPVRPSERLTAGQRANAFVDWGGAGALEGVAVDLPRGWTLTSARAVPTGPAGPVTLRLAPAESPAGRVLALAPATLRGAHHIVLGVTVGTATPFAEVTLTPLRRSGSRLVLLNSHQTAWGTVVSEAAPSRGRAFSRGSDGAPLVLDRRGLPGLHGDDNYTIESWVRSTGLGEVVLSAWDGVPDQTYPIEWIVDARGRLVVYRGEPGRHLGMRTRAPVADGRWHHVAVTQDAARGWARLYLDGDVSDSLRITASGLSNNALPLVVGGRRARDEGARRGRGFTGRLDELRIWSTARSPSELRYAMRLPLDARVAGLVRLGFDTPVPGSLLVEAPGRVFVPSDLSFWFPIEALTAQVTAGVVRIEWETRDRESERFIIERSSDGRVFRTVGDVRPADRVAEASDGTMRFAFTDPAPEGPLSWYRIRQRTAGLPDRLSGSLKLGRGAEGGLLARIAGNAPNPFREETVVSFETREPGDVRLTVWDVSGARIETLVDGPLPAGVHQVTFHARELPAGVYFVQLQTTDVRLTHKLTLSR